MVPRLEQVWVVDDDPGDLLITRRRFEKTGRVGEVRAFADPEEALVALRDEAVAPDLVVLDISMPRLDGFEFLEALGTVPFPVVLLTASTASADRDQAKSFDAVRGFELKPLTRDAVEQLVDRFGILAPAQAATA